MNPDWILTGLGRCSDCALAIARMGWNSGALGAEIGCEVEKTERFQKMAASLTAGVSSDTFRILEKWRLKFLYP